MAQTLDLDIRRLRLLTPKEQLQPLRTALSNSSDEATTQFLIAAVESGSISPSIFQIWLGVSLSPISIQEALRQSFSVGVRESGIVAFRKALKSPRWKEVWDGLGGVEGMLGLLSDFSVQEVRQMCVAIAASARGEHLLEKRENVSGLLKALLPDEFPESKYRTLDRRPLARCYRRLLPGCTAEVVTMVLNGTARGNWDDLREKDILRYHSDTVRKLILESVLNGAEPPTWLSSRFWEASSGEKSLSHLPGSMELSNDVMRVLIEKNMNPEGGIRHFFLERVVRRLVRRARKHKANPELEREVIDLALAFLRRHPKAATPGDLVARYGLVHLLSINWSRRRERFDGRLVELISIISKASKDWSLSAFVPLLEDINSPLRYDFLRLCFRTVTSRDIGLESDLKEMDVSWLSYKLLAHLESEQAVSLLARLRAARGDVNLIPTGPHNSILATSAKYSSPKQGDACLLYIRLLRRNGKLEEAEVLARERVQALQKKATTCSEQAQRAWYARSAINYATASGSRQLLKEVYTWAQRFVRDPLTCPTLYGQYTVEFKTLICSVPRKWGNVDLPQLRTRIADANSVLRLLFDTLCIALREPSFTLNSWSATLELFSQVVHSRMVGLRRAKTFSTDELYHSVWEGTVRLMVEIEKIGLTSGYERLSCDCMGGILSFKTYGRSQVLTDESPSTYRFLDELAKARDELWRKVRPTVHAAAASLPEPYPRGLPIQVLTWPYEIMVPNLEQVAPYVAKRANAAVFLNKTQASTPFPQDDESRAAIGYFIDSYRFAVRMLVPTNLEVREKQQRIERIWHHISTSLSQSRMTEEEAIRYWQNLPGVSDDDLKELWPCMPDPYKDFADAPIIPTIDDPTVPEEWDPLPPTRSAIKERQLKGVTYMDMSKYVDGFRADNLRMTNNLRHQPPILPGHSFKEPSIWSWQRIDRAKKAPAVREGQILSNLLYLDAANSSTTRISASPFPPERDVRFPALYLDGQFLKDQQQETTAAIAEHLKHVPPVLLAQLARNTLDSLDRSDPDKSGFITLENKTFTLIEFLSKSDRPGLATDIAIETIMKRPEASSWHRSLLSPRIFRALSASESRKCFVAFENAIITRLDEQAKAKEKGAVTRSEKEGPNPSTESKLQQPYVKITTVKFLAQLLRDSPFVPREFSIDVLARLAQRASHVDIKCAILTSLLEMFQGISPDLAECILVALEGFVPLVGTLNERNPLSEVAWADAEKSATPPEVDLESVGTTPMLTALLEYSHWSLDHPPQKQLLDRVVFPILDALKDDMKRWLTLFLASISVPAEEIIPLLPIVPRSLNVWITWLRHSAPLLPLAILDEYVRYLVFCIHPPPAVAALNERLANSVPDIRDNPHVQTWLALYNPGIGIVKARSAFSLLLGLPEKAWESPEKARLAEDAVIAGAEEGKGDEEACITRSSVTSSFLTFFKTALQADDFPKYTHTTHLLKEFGPSRSAYIPGVCWKAPKEAIQGMIDCIEEFRTGDAAPAMVPDTYWLRLAMLAYPSEEDEDEECKEFQGRPNEDAYRRRYRDAASRRFTAQIVQLVRDMLDALSRGAAYHHQLAEVKKCFVYMVGAERVHVSLCLAEQAAHSGAVDASADRTPTGKGWRAKITSGNGDPNYPANPLLTEALLVELSADLLKAVKWTHGPELRERERELLEEKVDRVLETWKRHPNEDIRRLGYLTVNPCVEVAKDSWRHDWA